MSDATHIRLVCWEHRHVQAYSATALRQFRITPICMFEVGDGICGSPIWAVEHEGEPTRYVGRGPHDPAPWAECVQGRSGLMIEGGEYRAGVVPLSVVAAKKPGHWIVRAFGPFSVGPELIRLVQRYVGTLDSEIEWTGYRYEGWPSYVVYGSGDIDGCAWPRGVYRFDHKGGDVYGPASRIDKPR